MLNHLNTFKTLNLFAAGLSLFILGGCTSKITSDSVSSVLNPNAIFPDENKSLDSLTGSTNNLLAQFDGTYVQQNTECLLSADISVNLVGASEVYSYQTAVSISTGSIGSGYAFFTSSDCTGNPVFADYDGELKSFIESKLFSKPLFSSLEFIDQSDSFMNLPKNTLVQVIQDDQSNTVQLQMIKLEEGESKNVAFYSTKPISNSTFADKSEVFNLDVWTMHDLDLVTAIKDPFAGAFYSDVIKPATDGVDPVSDPSVEKFAAEFGGYYKQPGVTCYDSAKIGINELNSTKVLSFTKLFVFKSANDIYTTFALFESADCSGNPMFGYFDDQNTFQPGYLPYGTFSLKQGFANHASKLLNSPDNTLLNLQVDEVNAAATLRTVYGISDEKGYKHLTFYQLEAPLDHFSQFKSGVTDMINWASYDSKYKTLIFTDPFASLELVRVENNQFSVEFSKLITTDTGTSLDTSITTETQSKLAALYDGTYKLNTQKCQSSLDWGVDSVESTKVASALQVTVVKFPYFYSSMAFFEDSSCTSKPIYASQDSKTGTYSTSNPFTPAPTYSPYGDFGSDDSAKMLNVPETASANITANPNTNEAILHYLNHKTDVDGNFHMAFYRFSAKLDQFKDGVNPIENLENWGLNEKYKILLFVDSFASNDWIKVESDFNVTGSGSTTSKTTTSSTSVTNTSVGTSSETVGLVNSANADGLWIYANSKCLTSTNLGNKPELSDGTPVEGFINVFGVSWPYTYSGILAYTTSDCSDDPILMEYDTNQYVETSTISKNYWYFDSTGFAEVSSLMYHVGPTSMVGRNYIDGKDLYVLNMASYFVDDSGIPHLSFLQYSQPGSYFKSNELDVNDLATWSSDQKFQSIIADPFTYMDLVPVKLATQAESKAMMKSAY